MDNQSLQAVVDEIAPILQGKTIGKIFQLAPNQLVIDFRPGDGRYLFLNFEPSKTPRIYLVRRRVRDLEKQSENLSNFVLFVRKRLSNARLTKIAKDAKDRVVRFAFLAENERGDVEKFSLVAQLTGRAANLYLLDAEGGILESLRGGQEIGEIYVPPVSDAETRRDGDAARKSLLETIAGIELPKSDYEFSPPSPISEKLDSYFSSREAEREFETNSKQAQKTIRQELERKEKLFARLQNDLTRHGNAKEMKKLGDLLLANAATAQRAGNKTFVIDFLTKASRKLRLKLTKI